MLGAVGVVDVAIKILSRWGITADKGSPQSDKSSSSRDRRGRDMEKGDGKRAPVVGEGWVVEGEMTCSRMDGAAAKTAAPSSRTDSAISEERPGYLVVAASKSVKNLMQTENPWYTNHARVDMARGE